MSAFTTKAKKLCSFCWAPTTSTYCNYCSTKDKRKVMIEKQIEINKENAKKGLGVTSLAYEGKTEEKILKEYGIEKPVY